MPGTLQSIFRYPVKGLSAEPLSTAQLAPGQPLANDRRFALAHGSVRFDPSSPEYLAPSNFLMLKKDEKLALLTTRFDDESEVLTIERQGRQLARGKITEPTGRMLVEQFLSGFIGPTGRGVPKLVEAKATHHFADAPEGFISLINLASVADLTRVTREEVDPKRFRANLWIEGLPAWTERYWVGQRLSIGGQAFDVVEETPRCAATNVNPETGERDMNLPRTLVRGYGHENFGVYLLPRGTGSIACGDPVERLDR